MAQQIRLRSNVDYYKALGVAEKARPADEDQEGVAAARQAVPPHSTGRRQGKESRFKDISNAYDVLGEPKKRALYDQIRAQGRHAAIRGPGPGRAVGVPTPTSRAAAAAARACSTWADLFSQFFQGGGAPGGPQPRPTRGRAPSRGTYASSRRRRRLRVEGEASDGSWLRVERRRRVFGCSNLVRPARSSHRGDRPDDRRQGRGQGSTRDVERQEAGGSAARAYPIGEVMSATTTSPSRSNVPSDHRRGRQETARAAGNSPPQTRASRLKRRRLGPT